MLDDDNSTPTTPQGSTAQSSTTTSRTRRRAAGRPAGPPAPISTDIFSAPPAAPKKIARAKVTTEPSETDSDQSAQDSSSQKAAAKKSTAKKAAPKKAASKDSGSKDADQASGDSPKADASDAKASVDAQVDDSATSAPTKPAGIAVAFQAPPKGTAPARRAAESSDDNDDSDDDSSNDQNSDGEGGAPKRRRRSRGGRRRNKGDDQNNDSNSDNSGDNSGDSDDSGSGDDADSGQGGTRRRRRRARAGENAGSSPDDPENTVVRVREGRNPEDEIASVTGSTRLEAKKQRRREGREAGRRRAPIVSEAEFLARRESVKREMVVRQHRGAAGSADDYTQIAVLEDGVLVEHYVARESQTSLIGNVYLGKVQNVLPSMEAAFVDIGAGRNAVIYAGEVDWSGVENGKARKIEEALSPGQQILVQVTKDPIGQKGARLTSQVSLPGRFLVYVPGGQSNGISRKLPDTERARLKGLLKEVLPEDAGVIVRTAAEGATEEQLTRDVTALTARWEDIHAKAGLAEGSSQGKAPQLLYAEPDLVIKVVRDLFNEDFHSLVVEGADAWDNISGYIQHVAPDLAERLQEWDSSQHDGRDSFDVYRVDELIHKALDRKVWLPSGGSLVIDRTEAMTVVDVNTGKFTGSGGNLEETVTKNNLEAAEEIVRQLRLRDIGGIIVIDFIDMVLESNRDLVLRRLVECLGRDRTRHQVAEVTSLGLVQMTRKRIGTGLLESFSTDCDHCKGRGVVITAEPVEPKKEEPRRGRRGRGGNGGGNNGNSGNNNGGGKKSGGKQNSAKDDSSDNKGQDNKGQNDKSEKNAKDQNGSEQKDSGQKDSAQKDSGQKSSDQQDAGSKGKPEDAPAQTTNDGAQPADNASKSTGDQPASDPVLTEPGEGQ